MCLHVLQEGRSYRPLVYYADQRSYQGDRYVQITLEEGVRAIIDPIVQKSERRQGHNKGLITNSRIGRRKNVPKRSKKEAERRNEDYHPSV